MRACGKTIRDMVKVLIGEMNLASCDVSIQEIGLQIENQEEEHFSIRMVIDLMDFGLEACLKEKEE